MNSEDTAEQPKLLLLGVFPMTEAERLRTELRARDVEVMFNHNEKTCGGACALNVEVIAHHEDLEKLTAYFSQERKRQFEGLDYDPNLAHAVYDDSKPEATCPACAEVFSTASKECPSCGLVLG